MKKEALRVSTTIPAAPTTLYYAWLNSDEHSQMTGATAKVDGNVGGKFTAWNGYISGKLVILDLGRRLVMAWRTTDFPRDAHDSRVEIHLEALGGSTRVTLLHTEIPEGQAEQYRTGWNEKYFDPMRAFFTKFLPDPRNPPPPRVHLPPPEDDEEEEESEPPKKGPASKKPVSGKPVSAKPAAPPPKSAKPEKKAEKPVAKKAEKPEPPKKADKKPEKGESKAAKADKKPEKKAEKAAVAKKADKKPAKAEKKADKKAGKADKKAGKPKKKK